MGLVAVFAVGAWPNRRALVRDTDTGGFDRGFLRMTGSFDRWAGNPQNHGPRWVA